MKKQPAQRVFQFSSIADKEQLGKIKVAINMLNGAYDESRLYSPKATHLVVDKMECTEKILCFIAAGKWIVTPSYIKNSYRENRFLNEEEFHVSIKFPRSKLAMVSLKWKEKIKERRSNYPCHDWRIACFLSNQEKAKAIVRIIEAGNGSCHLMKQPTRASSSRLSLSSYTLVICDELTKTEANEFANRNNLLCYPFQAIPDYLMQSPVPILPLKHYGALSSSYSALNDSRAKSTHSADKMELDESMQNKQLMAQCHKSSCDNFFETSYRKYFLATSREKTKIVLVDLSRESSFRIFWQNDGGIYEALNILHCTPSGELFAASTMALLYEYLLDQPFNRITKIQKSMSLPVKEATKKYEQIYSQIYAYLFRQLLNHPPTSSSALSHYHEIFENLAMSFRANSVSGDDIYGLIDVLYLMSVHDYIVFNTSHLSNIYHHISLRWSETDNEKLHKKLIGLLTELPDASSLYYKKLLEIVSFCNFYLNPSVTMLNVAKLLQKALSSTNEKQTHIDSLHNLFSQMST